MGLTTSKGEELAAELAGSLIRNSWGENSLVSSLLYLSGEPVLIACSAFFSILFE